MRRKVFLRSFFIALLSVLIVFLAGLCMTYISHRRLVSERLVAETKIAAALLDDSRDLERLYIFNNNDECRVTVISPSGEVLFESDTKETLTESHIDREEVRAALAGQPRAVRRYSETFHCHMTYYAVCTELGSGEEVILRLAIKSAETNGYLLSVLPFLFLALLVSALIAFGFARRLSGQLTDRITDIAVSLREVTHGTYRPVGEDVSERELSEVYREINELSERMVRYLQNEEAERERLSALVAAGEELARQKEEFFSNASHELKTPLTAMLGLTELAMERAEDETSRRQLQRIHKETCRLSELISDMLKLSRLESLKDCESVVSVSLDTLAHEVLTELSERIREKRIHPSVEGRGSVMADEKRMYELMQNLLTNAINYNKDGGEVTVELEETADGVRLTVRDTGIGIAEENIPHLCERFYRVDKSRSKKTGGTGLGLAIVKHICALYGAQIGIESTLGEGTAITVTFAR